MYLRRKCYSSLYDYDYNDYLYEKTFSDAYDYYYDYYTSRLFSDDEDYGKRGAAIGAGTALGLGALGAGALGIDAALVNRLDKIDEKVRNSGKGLDSLNKFDKKLLEHARKKEKKAILAAAKEAGLTGTVEELSNAALAGDKKAFDLLKKISDSQRGDEAKLYKKLLNKAKENKLAAAGIGAGSVLGLTGAGYGLGKLKKKRD